MAGSIKKHFQMPCENILTNVASGNVATFVRIFSSFLNKNVELKINFLKQLKCIGNAIVFRFS